jgi:hypothetical protein
MARNGLRGASVGEYTIPFDSDKYFRQGATVARGMRESRRLDMQEKKLQRQQEADDAEFARQIAESAGGFTPGLQERALAPLQGLDTQGISLETERERTQKALTATEQSDIAGETREEERDIRAGKRGVQEDIAAEERARGDETFTTDEAIRKEQELQDRGLKQKPIPPRTVQDEINIRKANRAAPKAIDTLRAQIASGIIDYDDLSEAQRRLLGKEFLGKSEEEQYKEARSQGIKLADLWVAKQDYVVEPEEYQEAVDRFTESYYEDMQEFAKKREAVKAQKRDIKRLKKHTERKAAKSEPAKETTKGRKTFSAADLKAVQKAKKAEGETFTLKQLREIFEGKGLKFK